MVLANTGGGGLLAKVHLRGAEGAEFISLDCATVGGKGGEGNANITYHMGRLLRTGRTLSS